MKKYIIILWFLMCSLRGYQGCAQSRITIPLLLKEMTDFDRMTKFPIPTYTVKQASSYDRRSVLPGKTGWFGNHDYNQFIRQERKGDHIEYVMMDADGPGVVVRFWLTTVVKAGVLRFYFDNEHQASVIIQGFDLSRGFNNIGPALIIPHSSYEVNGKGGNTLYLPLPYQKHCKVTWENTDTAASKTAHYYQINYRTYSKGTPVETFKTEQLVKYSAAIAQANALLLHPEASIDNKGQVLASRFTLAPGEKRRIQFDAGPHVLRLMNIKLARTGTLSAKDKELWHAMRLKMRFDGIQTVDCPLSNFIGSGFEDKEIISWYRTLTKSTGLLSRWSMPWRKKADMTLINTAGFPISIDLTALQALYEWGNNSMYFHASYKYEENVKDVKWDYENTKTGNKTTDRPIDWNFVTLKGKGVYIGNTLAVNNHMSSWYGEGDAKAYVDNEVFPSEFGTGLEDYYNTSWAPVVLYQTPFASATQADNASSQGLNTFTRTRSLDRIPFTRAFAFDMEMLSWDGGTIDIGATTYWYGLPGAHDTMTTP